MPQTTVTADHVERTERFECIRCRTDGRPVAEGRGGCELYGTMVTVTCEGEPLLDVVAFVCVLCEPMTAQVRVLLLANALARASEAMVGNG